MAAICARAILVSVGFNISTRTHRNANNPISAQIAWIKIRGFTMGVFYLLIFQGTVILVPYDTAIKSWGNAYDYWI